ncbi:MAG TPA: FimV/HubP family polar landmark protein [Burkholderiales bacterium]|nr:FimV/HubP family polar landmark protein [Burkholderiales bacterium]
MAQAPATPAPAPQAQAPQPAKPAASSPSVETKAETLKPRPKPVPPPPPEPGLFDEFLDNPLYLAALAAVVVLLVGYAAWSWRKKKAAHAKFQDSVLGAAAAGGGAAALHEPTANIPAAVSQAPVSQAPAGMEAEEVDPIAEADVYMAYGRDAQAEEILKEALQKDANRTAVHAKLLEIYASRKDARAFEQAALKLKGLTNGTGPDWEKAAALGRAIDPQNSVYGDVAAAAVAGAAAPAPTLDFDLGGASQGGPAAPDISLDETKEPTSSNVDIELGATNTLKLDQQAAPDQTLATEPAPSAGGLDFNLDLGGPEEKKPGAAAVPGAKPSEEPSGLDFNLDLEDKKSESPPPPPQPVAAAAAPIDLGDISLDLGGPSEETGIASHGSGDPKWQEVATKLDLAKAYEEMGDKDGARELLNEVMKDGDHAQKGQAEQLLAKLG